MFLKSEDICHVTALAAILNTDVQQIALLYTNSRLTHIQYMEWPACHVTVHSPPSLEALEFPIVRLYAVVK